MKKYLLFLFLASLLLSACAPKDKPLVGQWNLVSYGSEGSQTSAAADSSATLTFNGDETVTGNSGCNGFGGVYKMEGDRQVTFSEFVSTLMACSDPLMAQEGAMFKVLNGKADYMVDGNLLTITNNGAMLVFTAAKGQ